MTHWDRAALREVLETRFELDELQTAAFDLGVEYEGLDKDDLARRLVLYLERRQRLDQLVKWIKEHRDDINTETLIATSVSPLSRVELGRPGPSRVVGLGLLVGLLVVGTGLVWLLRYPRGSDRPAVVPTQPVVTQVAIRPSETAPPPTSETVTRPSPPAPTAVERAVAVGYVRVYDSQADVAGFERDWRLDTNEPVSTMGPHALLDISLANQTGRPVILRELEFRLEQTRRAVILNPFIVARRYQALIKISGVYPVHFDPQHSVDRKTLRLSQFIEPHGVDRFVVLVGHDKGDLCFTYAQYDVGLTLNYDENASLSLGQFSMRVPSAEPASP